MEESKTLVYIYFFGDGCPCLHRWIDSNREKPGSIFFNPQKNKKKKKSLAVLIFNVGYVFKI